MRITKKALLICLSFFLLIINTVPALAVAKVAILSADDVSLTRNTILVPVNISNNPGIMGFKVTASYPSELLEITSVVAGRVTTKGSFIHNAGKASGQVDIIWYATEQTVENGGLFILTVKPTEKFIEGESIQITLSFSQADTFNERYEDVEFDCKPINVSYVKDAQQTTIPDPTKEIVTEVSITDAQVIDVVDAALGNTESDSINDVDSDTLAQINDNLRIIAGSDAPQFSSVEELREQYSTAQRNEYSEQAQMNLDPSVISNTLTGVLNSRNASSFSELSESEKNIAVTEAYQKMQEADDTLPNISDYLTVDESAEMFDSLILDATAEAERTKLEKETGKDAGFPVYIIIIATVVICGIVVFFVYKRKNPKAQDKTNSKENE